VPKSIEQVRSDLLALMDEMHWSYADVAACVKIQHGCRYGERYSARHIGKFIRGDGPDINHCDVALAVLVAFPRLK